MEKLLVVTHTARFHNEEELTGILDKQTYQTDPFQSDHLTQEVPLC